MAGSRIQRNLNRRAEIGNPPFAPGDQDAEFVEQLQGDREQELGDDVLRGEQDRLTLPAVAAPRNGESPWRSESARVRGFAIGEGGAGDLERSSAVQLG